MATNPLFLAMMQRLFLLTLVSWATLLLGAQNATDSLGLPPSRSVRSTTLLGTGTAHLFDAYLSPLDYTGLSASITQLSDRRLSWWKGRVSQQRLASLHLAQTSNQAQTATLYDLEGSLALAYHYHFLPLRSLRLSMGPMLGLHAGGSYATRNGNNPAQGRLALDLSLSLRADYQFRLLRQTWRWHSQLDMPLQGLMFAPHFGQSYYEIFGLGHGQRTVAFTTPFNAPSLRLISTLSLPLWRGQFSLGIQSHIRQSLVHDLGRHAWHHHLVLGYTRTLQHLDP